jgi:8-oxo-dGTP pyrophosphatase MutT (NUDIX family)
VEPLPAATVALLRDGTAGVEVLLLKRSSRTGFIPGAYVFPGGRVDDEDTAPEILPRLEGITPGRAQDRLGVPGGGPPAWAFISAALRETFEETGVLLASEALPDFEQRHGPTPPGTTQDAHHKWMEGTRRPDVLESLRRDLLEGRRTFREVLAELDLKLQGDLTYIGHWVTPHPEPRRYDTRFFACLVPRHCPVRPDGREMVEAIWLTPKAALERNRLGHLPLVFPTLRTLETLAEFDAPADVLGAFARRSIPRRLPTLTLTSHGIRLDLATED